MPLENLHYSHGTEQYRNNCSYFQWMDFWMWHLGIGFRSDYGAAELMVGLNIILKVASNLDNSVTF